MTVLSVVIPVYNELNTWRELLRRVEAVDLSAMGVSKQIILVNDASNDGTSEQLESWWRHVSESQVGRAPTADADATLGTTYKLIRHEQNRGKGAALRSGFAAADGQIVIVQDADLEYDPQEYPTLIAPILEGLADVVYGSRFRRGKPRQEMWRAYIANRLLTFLSNRITHLGLTDMETCYKVFRREVLARVTIEHDRFDFEPEITAKVAGLKVRVVEVPISYHGRTRGEGKKIGFRDGIAALRCIWRYR